MKRTPAGPALVHEGRAFTPNGATDTPAYPFPCDECGRAIEQPTGIFGNYVVSETGAKVCTRCADEHLKRQMVETGRALLYYEKDAVKSFCGHLSFAPTRVRKSQGWGFSGPYPVVYLRFVGPDGKHWSGVHRGRNNTIVRCRRLAKQ